MARDVRDLPARTHPATRRDPAHDGGLRGLPEDRVTLGAPARVPELRTCRLLRLLAQPSRPRARRDDEPRRGALVRAGRGLALVLRGRDARLSGPADASPPGGMVRRLARVATMWPPPNPRPHSRGPRRDGGPGSGSPNGRRACRPPPPSLVAVPAAEPGPSRASSSAPSGSSWGWSASSPSPG